MISVESRPTQAGSQQQRAAAATGITIYGCESDEAVLFKELAPQFGLALTITEAVVSEHNVALAYGNRCISVSHKTHISNETLQALSEAGVTYISTRSAGFNHIDVEFARSLGITVGNVLYSPDSVADYTLMLILMSLRNAPATINRVQTRDFRPPVVRDKELRDLTVGVIGTGRIGAAVIARLQGFGCRVIAYDHHPKTSVDYVPLNQLLQQSDVVTFHTPLTVETHHMLNRGRMARMKPGAFVINTGRGGLIDTEALIEGLENGVLGGAALDVVEGEEGIFYADYRQKPLPNDLLAHLLALPNVIVTPHTAYHTEHALRDIVLHTINNCLHFERSK